MRFTFRFLVERAGTLLPVLALVFLAACNDGNSGRIPIDDFCAAEVSDLVGTWVLTSPAPDVVSKLSSCSDPSLDGRQVELNPLCLAPLPCAVFISFEVSGLEQGSGGKVIDGTGSGGRDRLLGIISLETCIADLAIIQADNPVHLRCQGFLEASTRTIDLICDAADVETSPGDDLLASCEVQPPIEARITITPSGDPIPL